MVKNKIIAMSLVLFSTSNLFAGEWVDKGYVVTERSYVLTKLEAEKLAIEKLSLQEDVAIANKKVQYFSDWQKDANQIIELHKKRSEELHKKWLDSEVKVGGKRNERYWWMAVGVGLVWIAVQVIKSTK